MCRVGRQPGLFRGNERRRAPRRCICASAARYAAGLPKGSGLHLRILALDRPAVRNEREHILKSIGWTGLVTESGAPTL